MWHWFLFRTANLSGGTQRDLRLLISRVQQKDPRSSVTSHQSPWCCVWVCVFVCVLEASHPRHDLTQKAAGQTSGPARSQLCISHTSVKTGILFHISIFSSEGASHSEGAVLSVWAALLRCREGRTPVWKLRHLPLTVMLWSRYSKRRRGSVSEYLTVFFRYNLV